MRLRVCEFKWFSVTFDSIFVADTFIVCLFSIYYSILSPLNMSESECPIQNPKTMLDSFSTMIGFVPIPHPPISDNLYCGFLLPIEYLEKSHQRTIAQSVSDDLELVKLTEPESEPGLLKPNKPMYEHFAEPLTDFGEMLIPEVAKRYTTNIGFLKDTQTVVLNQSTSLLDKERTARFIEVWKEIKEDKSFLERHNYMEYKLLEDLNKSRTFLNAYSVLNLVSPIYGLIIPLIIMLLPFVLLKVWNTPITFNVYLDTLREVGKRHFIGKILNIRKLNFENVMYVVFIGGMYILQTYNQVVSCIKFTKTIKRMNSNLLFIREYLDDVIISMDTFVKSNASLPYYSDFCQDIHSNQLVLTDLRNTIGSELTPHSWSFQKLLGLGHLFDCYYQLYASIDYEASLRYSVGFAGYIDILHGVSRRHANGLLGKTEFCSRDDSGIKTCFVDQYYPTTAAASTQGNHCVKNTVDVGKNMIITGVNASGKTTTLKTTALNIIFSQQFGFGFYTSGELTPYSHIHSYLNIPDTSGRDSLFQAESRRCKEILDKIKQTPTDGETHFCIFDELYSGTNPKEAAKSAYSLLKFLSKKQNVKFILTTHYVNVCRKFRKSEDVKNHKMEVNVGSDGEFIYTYKLSEGISTLEGGIAILRNMDYPTEILDLIEKQKM